MNPETASASLTAAPMHDDVWEDLLNYIEEKRVIPIVGPELLQVETETGPRLLLEWLAEKLAARLNVDPAPLTKPLLLNDVVCAYLANHGRREEAYTRLRTIMRESNFAPPLPLRQLAEITDFNLYVSMTFDPLLEQAVNAVRFGGAANTEVLAYAPNRVVDLPVERDDLQRPVVYHLLGRLSASPTYVISDEDMLEFVCALQSEHLTPEKLFHALEHNHLLVIGSDFSNWLARLFLRMTKRRRLSDPRDVGEILADSHSLKDVRLVSFLQQVAAREFGVSLDRVKVNATNTSKVPNTSATAASAGSDLNGMAVKNAADILKARIAEAIAPVFTGKNAADPTRTEDIRFTANTIMDERHPGRSIFAASTSATPAGKPSRPRRNTA